MSALSDRIAEVVLHDSLNWFPMQLHRRRRYAKNVAERIEAAMMEQSPDLPEWGKGYRAGVIEGMYRAAHNAKDHARATALGIPYEPGLPATDASLGTWSEVES